MDKKDNEEQELKTNIILASKNEIKQLKNQIEELKNGNSLVANNDEDLQELDELKKSISTVGIKNVNLFENEEKELKNENYLVANNPKKTTIETHDIVSFLIRETEEKRAWQVKNETISKNLLAREESLNEERQKNISLEKEQTKLELKLENLQSDKKRVDKKLSETEKTLKKKKEENSNLEKEKEELESKLKNLQSDKKIVDTKLSEKEKSLKKKEETNTGLEEEKTVLNNSLSNKEKELKERNEELKELKSFKKSIKSPKLTTLLNTLLENSALSQYRKKSKIVDESAESILNLLLKLSTGQIFVKSYYESLVEYKKENQNEMSSEEVAFYVAINEFFEEEIIENPKRTKIDGKFDKSKHRGINNEKEGTIDNGIVLIPSDTTNNDKIKVKLR